MATNKQRAKNEAVINGETGEIVLTTAAPTAPATLGKLIVAGFKLKKIITVPSLVMKVPEQQFVLRFDTAITVSKVIDPKKPDEKPASVATVTDMETCAQYIFLVPAVVKANLEQEFPEESYVGKIFLIKNLGQNVGKRYVNFGIAEVEVEVEAE
jgi:hypothetical protein